MKCKKCGGNYPCPEHTSIIDEQTGIIITPKESDEKTKQRLRDIRDVLKNI